ncbi:uncharacterized protein LOC110356082 isoform X2 [Columba livia]|uniref:uncharacterized protein LOC110356082 isoform X2 n=1 Tax=Columba livia TaxID=8932 RepID=UPI0031BB4199
MERGSVRRMEPGSSGDNKENKGTGKQGSKESPSEADDVRSPCARCLCRSLRVLLRNLSRWPGCCSSSLIPTYLITRLSQPQQRCLGGTRDQLVCLPVADQLPTYGQLKLHPHFHVQLLLVILLHVRGVEDDDQRGQRPQRRFWSCVRDMGEWQLTLLTFILFLTVWVLCNILLPRTITSLGIMGVSIYMARWANTTKVKGTCVSKSPQSSSGTDPMGEQPCPRAARGSAAAPGQGSPSQPEPCEGEEVSAESSRSGQCIPRQGELWRSSCDGEAASTRQLPRNRHSIGNMEELSRSLVDSLDIISICYDLMEELKETSQNSRTPVLHKSKSREYLVCLRCRRCLTSSCPHCDEPEDLPVLVVILHRLDMMMVEGKLVEMDLELKFELFFCGEMVYTWERMQVLPESAPEMSCKDCDHSLPTSLWGSECLKVPHSVLRTPQGQMGPDGQDTRAAPEQQLWTERSDAGSADLQPAGQGGSLHSAVSTRSRSPGDSETSQVSCPILSTQGTPEGQIGLGKKDTRAAPDLQPAGQGESLPSAVTKYPWPPWAQPLSRAALERLRRAGLEPLPAVWFKDLGPALSLQQRIQHSWDAAEWEQMVRLDLERRAGALTRTTEAVV